MKKILPLLILFTPLFSIGQFTAIPDANFEQALIDLGHDTGAPDGQVVTDSISGITSLHVNTKSISDLTGIEDFTALTNLECRSNQLTSLDLSQNTALTELNCFDNFLTSLDVTQNTALEILNCSYNLLTSLDVTQNTALEILLCNFNQLTSLDLSQNTALTYLKCSSNQLTSLDVTQNTALTNLLCYSNQLTSLDVTQNTALTDLDCYNNQLTSLDVTENTALTLLLCEVNQLTCLNVANGNNTFLTSFYAVNNPSLTCIEVDDVAYSAANWTPYIDAGVTFSNNCSNACSSVGIEEYSNQPRKLIRIIDLLGKETTFKPNTPLIYQYDDGSVEKVMEVW
jgi:Leucine-rich repeat (LRR) protein